ncbi:hypothetical protein FG93_00646 [Bosea sp. LC85]|nr:hypothetical protein FG93_00646 [Bosea sp. LC85]
MVRSMVLLLVDGVFAVGALVVAVPVMMRLGVEVHEVVGFGYPSLLPTALLMVGACRSDAAGTDQCSKMVIEGVGTILMEARLEQGGV